MKEGFIMTSKPFTSYNEQIALLERKRLRIPDKNFAMRILKDTSYFALINGYKDLFKDKSTGNYINDYSFDDIYNLYMFDDSLRNILIRLFCQGHSWVATYGRDKR